MNKRILISFSGGKTSAYMTYCLLKKYEAIWFEEHKMFLGIERINGMVFTVEILVVFANTSKERNETLDFVNECDKRFGFHTIWIEAVTPLVGKCSYKITDYENACRNGDVYEQVIARYGIPNHQNPHCTRELKANPITKLCRDYGWNNLTYYTAIGYRIDEPHRWGTDKKRKAQKEKKHLYYFVDEFPQAKKDVNGWWGKQPFNLMLQEHEGNCDLCFKKDEKKNIANVGNNPKLAEWWLEMEYKYGNVIPHNRVKMNTPPKPPFYFYRGYKSMQWFIDSAEKYFKSAKGDEVGMEVYTKALLGNYNPNQLSICAESCEPF